MSVDSFAGRGQCPSHVRRMFVAVPRISVACPKLSVACSWHVRPMSENMSFSVLSGALERDNIGVKPGTKHICGEFFQKVKHILSI